MADLQVGATREEQVLVGHENAITFLGTEGPRVLSTPHMIGAMERTCRNLVLPMLGAGLDTVGTHVNMSHAAAAPIGCTVTFRAELTAVEKRRLEFRVEVRMGATVVGEGTHQRAIIDVKRFAEKMKGI